LRPLDFPALFGPDDGDDLAIVHVEAEPLADEALAVAGVDLRDLQEGPPNRTGSDGGHRAALSQT